MRFSAGQNIKKKTDQWPPGRGGNCWKNCEASLIKQQFLKFSRTNNVVLGYRGGAYLWSRGSVWPGVSKRRQLEERFTQMLEEGQLCQIGQYWLINWGLTTTNDAWSRRGGFSCDEINEWPKTQQWNNGRREKMTSTFGKTKFDTVQWACTVGVVFFPEEPPNSERCPSSHSTFSTTHLRYTGDGRYSQQTEN